MADARDFQRDDTSSPVADGPNLTRSRQRVLWSGFA